MMHPDTSLRFISHNVGFGVFATADIARGTMIWVKDPLDQVVSYTWVERIGPQLQRFLYADHRGDVILLWDHARYVNHSCTPNTAGGLNVEVSVALRDIRAGEEITEDYRELPWFLPFDCRCGATECKRRVEPPSMPARLSPYEPLVAALRQEASVDEGSGPRDALLSDLSQTILTRSHSPQASRGRRTGRQRGRA